MVRIVVGAVLMAASAAVFKMSGERVMRGLAMLFGATGMLAIGGYILVGGVWRAASERRRRRRGAD